MANTGFTGVQNLQQGGRGPGERPRADEEGIHPGDAGGHLTLWTYSGTAQGTSNNQVNALQAGFDSSSDFRVYAASCSRSAA